jgi:cytochrome b
MNTSPSLTSLRIWDLPTRLFHILLIACVAGLIITGEIGGDIMTLHFYLGYAVLTLVFFRLVWGVVGGHWSRFIHFIPTLTELRAYIASLKHLHAQPSAGHNPLGALSVLTMLLVLLAQVLSGFLSDDEVSVSGPWTAWAPGAWVEWASEYHTEIGKAVLISLVLLHVGAVLFHKYIKGDDLITPMVSGDKELPEDLARTTTASADTWVTRTKALVVLALCAYAVYRVVNFTLTV